jgi:hypothetical protein
MNEDRNGLPKVVQLSPFACPLLPSACFFLLPAAYFSQRLIRLGRSLLPS